MRSPVVGLDLPGAEFRFANHASQTDRAVETGFLKNGLDPLVQARLTQVVQRLREGWVAEFAPFWGQIRPINEDSVGDLEKRVSATLRLGFFEFSQFLDRFVVLFLELQQLGVVREKTLLGLEQLVVELGNRRCDLIEISHSKRCLTELLCGIDRGSNERQL